MLKQVIPWVINKTVSDSRTSHRKPLARWSSNDNIRVTSRKNTCCIDVSNIVNNYIYFRMVYLIGLSDCWIKFYSLIHYISGFHKA